MPVIALGLLAFGMFLRITDLLEEVEHLKKKVHLLNTEVEAIAEKVNPKPSEEDTK